MPEADGERGDGSKNPDEEQRPPLEVVRGVVPKKIAHCFPVMFPTREAIMSIILHDIYETTNVLMVDDITSTTTLVNGLRTAETSLISNLADVAAEQRRVENDLKREVERKKRSARKGWSGPGTWKFKR